MIIVVVRSMRGCVQSCADQDGCNSAWRTGHQHHHAILVLFLAAAALALSTSSTMLTATIILSYILTVATCHSPSLTFSHILPSTIFSFAILLVQNFANFRSGGQWGIIHSKVSQF